MQVAVIGGGVVGVCTAYFLAEAGHEVVVLEKRSHVAEQASFGIAGIMSPSQVQPWAAPEMPKKLLGYLFKRDAPVLFKPTLDRTLWRWMRMWLSECELNHYIANKQRMQRVAFYSRDMLKTLCERHALEYEQTRGLLQLFRSERDMEAAMSAFKMLADQGAPHHLLDASAVRTIEPALSSDTQLAGALHLPHDEAGNCPLFTKQLRYTAQTLGVEFHFHSPVDTIEYEGSRLAFHIENRKFQADAVVLAAGNDSATLLANLGIRIPLYPLKGYSATASIKNFDEAPLSAITDEASKVAIARMGNRIRIAGLIELGATDLLLRDEALRLLIKAGTDWFPHAANYHTANFWCGARPSLPDGPPIIGATPMKNLFVNIGHGSHGWAMAAGSGKIIADLVSGKAPEIDLEGLTLSRFM
jgi:D-amino-acid dehydrogenase